MKPDCAVLMLVLLAGPAAAQNAWREPNTGMEFVAVPKGCYRMGVPDKAFTEDDPTLRARVVHTEMPEHEVCLDAFWIGRHEVRQSDWSKVMGPRAGSTRPDLPVGGVSWEEAREFAARLTRMSGGRARFRLPTEAEWEYACRAGTLPVTRVPDRSELDDKAWYSSPYDADFSGVRIRELQPVGRKAPNAWGLHDMLGNAWEWVQDAYRPDAYARHSLYNPVIDAPPEQRVIRGGSLHTDQRMLRCEARAWLPATDVHATAGLRLVRIQK